MDNIRFNEEDFNGYLYQLIESGKLDSMQLGIAKLVIDKGYEILSPKQRKVFDHMIDTNAIGCCRRGACDIPWCEMFEALYNGGYCNYCQHMMEKLVDE